MPEAGQELLTDGDHVPMTCVSAGTAGDAVVVTGNREVDLVNTSNGRVDGQLANDVEAGEEVAVNMHGAYYQKVTSTVTADSFLTGSTTAGSLREINTGGATGEDPQARILLTLEDSMTMDNGQEIVLTHYQ